MRGWIVEVHYLEAGTSWVEAYKCEGCEPVGGFLCLRQSDGAYVYIPACKVEKIEVARESA